MDPLRSSSPVKPRCFLKIILSHVTPHSTLMIPRKFITAHRYDLANKVFLKAPGSSVLWNVDLVRSDGEAILSNGWPEFAAYYSICIGHVLLFKYQGDSQFHVTILDTSCTEIEYPRNPSHSEQARHSKGVQKRKELAPIDDQHKRIKPVKVEVDLDEPMPHVISGNGKGASESENEEGKARALALAKAFKSNKPFSMRKVYPSHVDGSKRGMYITKAFKEAYKNWKEREQVILQIAERTWLVYCLLTPIGYRLGKGWLDFARDSSLTVGDVCVFELVNSSEKLFRVIVYRSTV